ncbi:MAG: acetylserotonin O-methyltransferase [Acidobacteria bacterium]|nr:acetylserotonin O-methyltransferase [Acidobacteriota bacterium]
MYRKDDAKSGPAKILELSGKYWESFALHAGVELDIFTLLDEEGMTIDEISSELSLSKRGTKALVSALASLGFLEKEGDIFYDSRESVEYLSKNSPEYLGYMIRHHHYLSKYWAQLPKAVKNGKPVRKKSIHNPDKAELEAFLMGMFNNASLIAPKIAEILDLKNCKTLLDLGGGPGTYAIHFCLKNPQLEAKIYDLKHSAVFAEGLISGYGLKSRIKFVPFDFTKEKIKEKFDAVWLSHILHGEGESTAKRIVKKAASSLNKGGKIFIHEFILNDDNISPKFPAIFSLNMLLGTNEGKSYTESEIKSFLEFSGITEIENINFEGPSQSRIISGRKK